MYVCYTYIIYRIMCTPHIRGMCCAYELTRRVGGWDESMVGWCGGCGLVRGVGGSVKQRFGGFHENGGCLSETLQNPP